MGSGARAAGSSAVQLRPPVESDAAEIWRLVERSEVLDGNSPYAYLLLCTHFSQTGLVARLDGELAGFVLGYARPDHGESAFVWQVAVAEPMRGRGLGGQLLDAWFAQCARHRGVRYLEATVTPSNRASKALFASFAHRHLAPIQEALAFPSTSFPDGVAHEDEVAVRVGPVSLARACFPRQLTQIPQQETT